MIENIFDWCVRLLLLLAEHLGVTYKEINVWIFVIIWPLFTLILILIVIRQQQKIHQLLQEQSKDVRSDVLNEISANDPNKQESGVVGIPASSHPGGTSSCRPTSDEADL